MKEPYILIPAFNPAEDLSDYVNTLRSRGFKHILIVDDGSNEKCRNIFNDIAKIKGCTVIHHAVNLGKGRAMKNGFNYFLNLPNLSEFSGVITVDSDGQHGVEDVVKIAEALKEHPDSLIMGCRDFTLDFVPKKSSFGNKMTCRIFRLLYGVKLKDTQTGLRGFPTSLIPMFIQLYGERFELETSILIEAALKKIPVEEIDIQTIYINNNSETHFRAIQDSWAIYSLIFKSFFLFICSSLASFIIDIGMFQLFMMFFKRIGMSGAYIVGATISARVVSSLFNYFVNKTVVFKNMTGKRSVLKYYILCVCQMLVSAGSVNGIYHAFHAPEVLIKVVVDSLLFCISYQIQQRWVFSKKD